MISGYIRFIDTRRLVALAKHYHVTIRVLRRVGHFVPAGIPLMMVSKGNRLSPEGTAELLAAFDFGPTRTLQQDVEFGVLQIVDIALKAISPAVNDPTTAISCVDQLSRILIRFASRRAARGSALRSARRRSRQHWMDPLRAPAGVGLRADPHVFEDGRGRQPAAAASSRRYRRLYARPGVPPDPRRAGNADCGRLRRKARRRRAERIANSPGRAGELDGHLAAVDYRGAVQMRPSRFLSAIREYSRGQDRPI